MKIFRKSLLLLMAIVAVSAVSCINDPTDPADQGGLPSNVASLSEQAAAMKASVGEMETMLSSLAEMADVEECVSSLEAGVTSAKEHIASIESGLSGSYAAIVTMKLQGQLAEALAALKVKLALIDNEDFNKVIPSIEKGVASWLGKDFKNYFSVTLQQITVETLLEIVKSQSISAGALASDVEAGLRVGDATELGSVVDFVGKNLETLSKLEEELGALNVEVEEAYTEAIKSQTSSTKNTLKSVNTKSSTALAAAESTLSGLLSRVAQCETAIAELKDRLTLVETDIKNLLAMIQSVTFLSEFSEEKAIAYYNLNPDVVDDEGRQGRTPVETIKLNYLVRPASAVTAFADMDSWSENGLDVKVQGYFADMIAVKSFDKEFIYFTIDSVTADAEKGLLTINANSSVLTDDFFMKKVGAKLALSVQAEATDIVSKFVEIVPRDQSGNVYIESMTLDARSLEIKQGDTDKLTATLTPSGVTVTGCDWSSSVPEVASIDENGNITANIVGTTVITATTKGTNEWGQKLTATCKVTVQPNVRIIRPQTWVETWATANFTLQMSDNFEYTKIEWAVSNDLATIDNSGTLTGVNFDHESEYAQGSGVLLDETYKQTYVYCKIYNGSTEPEVTLVDSITVVAKQPRGIDISGLSGYDDPNRITLKFNQELNLGTMSVSPAEVNSDISSSDDHFYVSAYSVDDEAPITYKNGTVTAKSTIGEIVMRFVVSGKTKWWAPDHSVNRWVTFAVEPYWVETMTLPATYKMAQDATANLTPEWTTDVDGYDIPSDKTLIWESDNPSAVSVDAKTGLMTAIADGRATITATTAGANSRPEGEAPISSSCVVTVESPTDPYDIGYYYYSDGTWGESATPTGTSVIGVIFSTYDATSSDSKLREAYPDCTHGLVLSTQEYSSIFGYMSTGSLSHGRDLFVPAGYDQMSLTASPMGYYQTQGWLYYHNVKNADWSNAPSGLVGEGMNGNQYRSVQCKHTANVPVPATASSWYIPSYSEMLQIYKNLSTINSKLLAAGGTSVATGDYWLSTVQWTSDTYMDIKALYTFNMSSGDWGSGYSGSTVITSTSCPVRLVLAF